jgi:hypothetical protein
MAGTVSTVISWIDTGIDWIKKGIRRGKVNKIDSAVNSHNESAVNDIVQGIEKNRDKRTNAS